MSSERQQIENGLQATKCRVSDSSPMFPCNYPSAWPLSASCHVIPDKILLPCVAVWHEGARTVFCNPIARIDGTTEAGERVQSDTADRVKREDGYEGPTEDDESKRRYYDVIRHDGRVSFLATVQASQGGDIGRSHWVSTPRDLAFSGQALPISLMGIPTEGGCGKPETECLREGETAHIDYFKNDTGSMVPHFVDDPTGKRSEAVTRALEECQTGKKPWLYRGGAWAGVISRRNAEASVSELPSDSLGMSAKTSFRRFRTVDAAGAPSSAFPKLSPTSHFWCQYVHKVG
jgi:hypothetical protein